MKTSKYLWMFVAVAAATLATGCAKDAAEAPDTNENNVVITITADNQTINLAPATRTFYDGGKINWSATGEELKVVETIGGATTSTFRSTTGYTLTGTKAAFTVGFPVVTGSTQFNYAAIYPASAYVTSSNTKIDVCKINLPQIQHPTATSYDPAADLMITKPISQAEQATSLNLQFGRIIAIGHLSVKNLGLAAGEFVKNVTFTAPTKIVTGRGRANLATGNVLTNEWGYGKPTDYAFDNVVMNYADNTVTAGTFEAWFTCAPFEVLSTENFSVEVQTNKKIYTKTCTGKALPFTMGAISSFGVDMTSVVGVDRVPEVTTEYATAIEQTTATLPGSYITNDCAVSEAGFIYSTTTGTPEEMLVSGKKVTCTTSTTPFSYDVTGLTAGTKYYYCAYVNADVNKVAYGKVLFFETKTAGGPVEYNETFENYHVPTGTSYDQSNTFAGVTEGTPTWTYVGCGNPVQATKDRKALQDAKIIVINTTYITIGKNTDSKTSGVTVTIPGGITSLKFNYLTKTKGKVTIPVNGVEIKSQDLKSDTKEAVEIANIDCGGNDAVIAFSNTTTSNRITIGDVRWTK
ncbi:MAG: hypothetical protein RR971_03615 [Alistipes sp.]